VATLYTGGAVITLIDHITGTVYDINALTSDGWPTTYTLAPDHIYFDEETNYLYVSVRGEYDGGGPLRPPVVLKINLNQYDDSQDIPTCATLADDMGFLDCDIWDGDTDLTKGEGQFKIMGRIGGRLYAMWDWYNLPGGVLTTWPHHPAFFGWFNNQTGDFNFLWAYGDNTEVAADAHFVAPAMGYRGDAATGYDRLKAWDFDSATGALALAYSPVVPSGITYISGSYCFVDGWETFLADIDVNLAIDQYSDRNSTYRYFIEIEVGTEYDPISAYYYYWGTPTSPIYDHTFNHHQVDCSGFAGGGMVEIYFVWTAPDPGALVDPGSPQLGLGINFSTGATGMTSGMSWCAGAATPDGKSALTGLQTESIVMAIDPDNPILDIYVGFLNEMAGYTSTQNTKYDIWIREFPYGASYAAGVHSPDPVRQIGDDRMPDTITQDPDGVPYVPLMQHSTGTTSGDVRTEPTHLAKCDDTFMVAMLDESAAGIGLWRIRQDGTYIDRLTSATSDLIGDKIQGLARVGTGGVLVASGDNSIQYYDNEAEQFTWGPDFIEFTPGVALDPILGVTFDGDWIVAWNSTEVWWMIPSRDFLVGGRPGFTRHVRNWWNGDDPDAVVGAGGTVALDSLGRPAGFENVSFGHSKGEASYELTFSAHDVNYLPWIDSAFNENVGAPGTFGGTLDHGARIYLERGILGENGYWTWLPECQTFIVTEPGSAADGIAAMNVTARGVIGTLLTRSIYEFTHRPEETAAADVALISDDGYT
jgi:hypothetical protein